MGERGVGQHTGVVAGGRRQRAGRRPRPGRPRRGPGPHEVGQVAPALGHRHPGAVDLVDRQRLRHPSVGGQHRGGGGDVGLPPGAVPEPPGAAVGGVGHRDAGDVELAAELERLPGQPGAVDVVPVAAHGRRRTPVDLLLGGVVGRQLEHLQRLRGLAGPHGEHRRRRAAEAEVEGAAGPVAALGARAQHDDDVVDAGVGQSLGRRQDHHRHRPPHHVAGHVGHHRPVAGGQQLGHARARGDEQGVGDQAGRDVAGADRVAEDPHQPAVGEARAGADVPGLPVGQVAAGDDLVDQVGGGQRRAARGRARRVEAVGPRAVVRRARVRAPRQEQRQREQRGAPAGHGAHSARRLPGSRLHR